MYKLVNIKTQKERLCQKIQIENFDYYISDEGVVNPCYFYNKPTSYLGKALRREGNFWVCENIEGFHLLSEAKKIIATNNPSINIPKVVDEVEKLAYAHYTSNYHYTTRDAHHFRLGYNKSQQTHPFSLNDIKEIINLAREQYWDIDNRGFSSNTEGDWSFKYSTEDEIIQKYQENKILTIFYE